MKKATIVLIGVIYLASIILVGIYGLQYKKFNQIVYSTSVEVINKPNTYITKDGEQIKTYFVEKDPATGLRQFQIEWRVEPIETVTNKNVRFIYTDDPATYSVDSKTGLVEFYQSGVITITVVPDDNSDCSDKIIIYCLD